MVREGWRRWSRCIAHPFLVRTSSMRCSTPQIWRRSPGTTWSRTSPVKNADGRHVILDVVLAGQEDVFQVEHRALVHGVAHPDGPVSDEDALLELLPAAEPGHAAAGTDRKPRVISLSWFSTSRPSAPWWVKMFSLAAMYSSADCASGG